MRNPDTVEREAGHSRFFVAWAVEPLPLMAEVNEGDGSESVSDAIRSAFAGAPRGRITIQEAEVVDSDRSTSRRQEPRRRVAAEG
jgi:hypothetical protein